MLEYSYQALCIKIACRTVAHSYSRRSLEASLGAASLAPQAASLAASAVGSQPDLCSADEILTDLPVCIPVKHMGGSCSRWGSPNMQHLGNLASLLAWSRAVLRDDVTCTAMVLAMMWAAVPTSWLLHGYIHIFYCRCWQMYSMD